jgi:hypothetical protein
LLFILCVGNLLILAAGRRWRVKLEFFTEAIISYC